MYAMDEKDDDINYYDDDAEGKDSDYDRTDDSDSDSDEAEDESSESSEEDDAHEPGDAPHDAEDEIEGDFDRLIANIRDTDGAAGSEMMTKQWDFSIEDKDAEFRDDLRAASGIGRKRHKGARQVGPILSQQVKALVGEGNQAFVDGDIPGTLRVMQEVIRIEPRAASAWAVLAQCYADLGDPLKELQLRIMAAHLRHDADEWERLARSSRELGYNQQALYCFGKLYSLDPANVDALWDRAALAQELGELRTARHSYLAILKRFPHDLTTLDALRTLLIELGDLSTCAALFQAAFDHYAALYPVPLAAPFPFPFPGPDSFPQPTDCNPNSIDPHSIDPNLNPDPSADADAGGCPFGQMEVLVLTDLYNTLARHEDAVHAIRRGSRWLQGRAREAYWDACEDDREFDLRGDAGEGGGVGAGAGMAGAGMGMAGMVRERGGEGEGELVAGYFPLDVNARHRLAIARIKMGDVEEGKMHANIVLAEDLLDYAPLFAEIADAYFEREMYAEASGLYELLGEDPVTSTFSILLNAAACRRMLGNLKEAVELYKTVIEADPTHNDAKMKLAELYEILDEPRKALELVYQVIDARAKSRSGGREQTEQPEQPAGGSNAPRASLFEESTRAGAADKRAKTGKTPKLTAAQLKELEDQKESEVAKGWKRILELWPAMLGQDGASGGAEREAAEREWMMEAEKLVEMFRETRVLFLAGKTSFRGVIQRKSLAKGNTPADEQRMASRLELLEQTNSAQKGKDGQQKTANVTIFRGLFFDEWMKLFIQYTFQLTKSGQYDLADEILRHVGYSNAYQSREKQDTLHCALISCALHCRKYTVVVEQSRKLINTHQFNNEAIRILVASLASGWRPAEAFILSTLQKFLLRELRLNEAAVKTPEALRYITHSRRYIVKTEKADIGDDGVDADDDAVLDDDADASSLPGKHNPGADITIPTKHNPAALAVYGQISIGVRSYQTAIYYLLQAYDHAPEDPMICLNLAIASIGRSMQRQADNRHHLVAQGLAFLSRYRSLRKHAPGGSSEVEFNFARAFQQLGLYSHAVKHYERVLELAEENPTDDTVLSREAAYNLSQIYVITGAVPLARALYRRWLSL